MNLGLALAGLLVVFSGAVALGAWFIIRYRTRIDAAARRFLGRIPVLRWAAELGIAATLGLALGAWALFLFASIAEDTRGEGERLVAFDTRLAQALHDFVPPAGLSVMRFASFLGSTGFVAALGLAVGALLALRRRWALLIAWAAALAGAGALNQLLKHLFVRPRPPFADPGDHADTWSFPSGHSMGSLVAYGMLAYIVIALTSRDPAAPPAARTRATAISLAAGLVLLIGISRIALGVHYFSDVAGGFAAGAAWLASCISWAEVQRPRNRA